MEIALITSKENREIKFDFPWHNSRSRTISVGLKEFMFDNFIENVDDKFTIHISEKKKDSEKVLHRVLIEQGNYEIKELLSLINQQLDKFNDKIKFGHLKHSGKVYVDNSSKYFVTLSESAKNFLKLPLVIPPEKTIKAQEIFEVLPTDQVFVRVKNISSSIHTNTQDKGSIKFRQEPILFVTPITNDFGQKKIVLVPNEPVFHDFFNPSLKDIEISITDVQGKLINLKNIKLTLYFKKG